MGIDHEWEEWEGGGAGSCRDERGGGYWRRSRGLPRGDRRGFGGGSGRERMKDEG